MELASLYAGRERVIRSIDFMLAAQIVEEVHDHRNHAWVEQVRGRPHWIVGKGVTPLFPGQKSFVGGSLGEICGGAIATTLVFGSISAGRAPILRLYCNFLIGHQTLVQCLGSRNVMAGCSAVSGKGSEDATMPKSYMLVKAWEPAALLVRWSETCANGTSLALRRISG